MLVPVESHIRPDLLHSLSEPVTRSRCRSSDAFPRPGRHSRKVRHRTVDRLRHGSGQKIIPENGTTATATAIVSPSCSHASDQAILRAARYFHSAMAAWYGVIFISHLEPSIRLDFGFSNPIRLTDLMGSDVDIVTL